MLVPRLSENRSTTRDIAAAVIAATAAFTLAELIRSGLGVTRLGLFFLAAVTVVAGLRGTRAAILSALASMVAYKLFLDLRAGEQTGAAEDILNLAIFVIVALLTGALAGRLHDEAGKSRMHGDRMELLFRTSRLLAEEDSRVWPVSVDALSLLTGGGDAIAVDPSGNVKARCGSLKQDPAAVQLGKELLNSDGKSESNSAGGWRARTLPATRPYAGALVWQVNEPSRGTEETIELLVDLASASVARALVREEQIKLKATEEAGKLREALLSSISHDFRSPLAAIIGSATSLLEYGDKFDDAVRRDLLLNIQDEGEKLNQFVANLLNMTRLQSGVVKPRKQAVQVAEVINAAVERLRRHRGTVPALKIDAECEIEADPLLLEQAIYNILDNAAKYADTPEGVHISCALIGATAEIIIADHGPGLDREDREGVFTTFHFAKKNGETQGTGLGLSISKGFVEAMGGTIQARCRGEPQTGLEIAITLPRSMS